MDVTKTRDSANSMEYFLQRGISDTLRPLISVLMLLRNQYDFPCSWIQNNVFFFFFLARVVAYLSRVLESAFTALEGLNKQAFLTELVWNLFRNLLGPYICDFNIFNELSFHFHWLC